MPVRAPVKVRPGKDLHRDRSAGDGLWGGLAICGLDSPATSGRRWSRRPTKQHLM